MIPIARRFLEDFLKAIDWHKGHGTPSIDRVQAILLSAEAHAALQSSEPEAIPIAILRQHWLHQIECDHQRKMDRPICACSTVDLGWHASVGEAVEFWLLHVQGVANKDAEVVHRFDDTH